MYLVINKCVTAVKVSHFSGHYLCNLSTLDIGVLGYIGILSHKEHPLEVWHIPPGTLCVLNMISVMLNTCVWNLLSNLATQEIRPLSVWNYVRVTTVLTPVGQTSRSTCR